MLIILPSPHLEVLAHPSIPKMLRAREHAPIPYPSAIFTFKLAVESTKEFGGASHGIKALVELDPPIGEF